MVPVVGCLLRHHVQRVPFDGSVGRPWGSTTQATSPDTSDESLTLEPGFHGYTGAHGPHPRIT